MSILDELLKLIVARGGSTKDANNIAEAVEVLVKLEKENAETPVTPDEP